MAAGKRVGVTANSHKVIGELLEKTANVARERGIAVAIGQRPGKDGLTYPEAIHLGNNAEARDALNEGTLDVVGGTAWLWARDDMVRTVDVLFIDEAGQMSLADAIAASSCATNLVLLGDPQQLDQPLQGTHPPGAERSALGHVLDSEQVMPDRLGLFLDGTWRLHPTICAYTSEVLRCWRRLSRISASARSTSSRARKRRSRSIYSMATSSAADAPRGMEFLYSLNRLNVATSRAQCVAAVVASPDILRVRCRTPRQMRLANALARLVEFAST